MENTTSHNRSAYQHYPYLTQEEFAEACHLLDSRYCRATIGPLRKQWRLNVHTALNMSFAATDSDFVTFLQITQPLDENTADEELASQLGTFCLGGGAQENHPDDNLIETDEMMVEMEDSDRVSEALFFFFFFGPHRQRNFGIVAYSSLIGRRSKANISANKISRQS